MDVEEVESAARALLQGLPTEIARAIRHVELTVLDAPSTDDDDPPDAKGVFEGFPQQGEPDDTDDSDAGEWFDVGQDGRMVHAGDGGFQEAEGEIVLFAANLRTTEEVEKTLLHEIGHALGEDEDEVDLLGLDVDDQG